MLLTTRNLNTLPVLRALLEEASVVGAAKRVGLSQPTVSGILARLRTDFDDPLLVRAGRGMQLTPRARDLLPAVAASCDNIESLYKPVVFEPATLERSFVVAAPDHLAFLAIPHLLQRLAEEAPGVHLRFVDVHHDLDEQLAAERVDLALCGQFGFWPSLCFERLFTERIVAAVSLDHPLASRRRASVDELREFPTSTMDTRAEKRRSSMTGVPSIDADATITLAQFTDAVLLTIGTDLVAPAPEALVDRLAQILPITKIHMAEADGIEAGMFWSSALEHDPAHVWLRGVVRDAATAVERPR